MKKLTLPTFWILLLIVFLNVSCQSETLTGKSSDEILQRETIENFEGALQTMNRQEKTVEGRLDIRKRKSNVLIGPSLELLYAYGFTKNQISSTLKNKEWLIIEEAMKIYITHKNKNQ